MHCSITRFTSLTVLFFCAAIVVGTPGSSQVINEYLANHTGTDDHEYIEVLGEPSTSYANLTIVQIEGDIADNPGHLDSAIAVGSTDVNGYWWTGFLANELHNDNSSLLVVDGFSGTVGQDLDSDDDGILDTTPWSAIDDEIAFDTGGLGDLTYGFPVLNGGFDGLPAAPGGASRVTSGFDTDTVSDWIRNDFDGAGLGGFPGDLGPMEAFNTPGLANRRLIEDYYATVVTGDPVALRTTLHDVIDDHIRHSYSADVTDTWDILDRC